MPEQSVRLVNRLGLHARAAAQVVRIAKDLDCEIILKRADTQVEANAKSILALLGLSASHGVELVLRAEGPDASRALSSISVLFEQGFGEE
jgi:phosphocarrier protein HPr